MSADGVRLKFKEAIAYFDQKLNLPSAVWADILHGAHTKAFTVAGAMKDDLLVDLRVAVRKAVADGMTLDQFRKDFDTIVAKHGWAYNGGRAWRTKVIYDTNTRVAWNAGRYAQMTDPGLVRRMPYWRYNHSPHSKVPRPQHLAWDGLVLRWDDPWWKTHYPPNGWGCNCWVDPLSPRDLAKLGKDGPDTAPPLDLRPCTVHTSGGPVVIDVPKGIDPGWGYNVGETAFGRPLAEDVMAAWKAEGARAWRPMDEGGGWQNAGRPERLPPAPAPAPPMARAHTPTEARAAIEALLGAEEKAFRGPDGTPVLVDASVLASRLAADQTPFLPLLPDLIEHPTEIWGNFEEHIGTGKVTLRRRFIKVIGLPEGSSRRFLVLMAQVRGGCLETWTVVPSRSPTAANAQRSGALIWPRSQSGDATPDQTPG